MKILLIGGCGSIGRRYAAILKYMGKDFAIHDPALNTDFEKQLKGCDKALICSPTPTHHEWAVACNERQIPFLIEKPYSFRLYEAQWMRQEQKVPAHLVCNYKFALNSTAHEHFTPLALDYYNQGKDPTMAWNCCQLVYLNPDITLNDNSPVWNLKVKNRRTESLLPYRQVEIGYIEMLDNWLNNDGRDLWTMDDAVKMILAVYRYEERMAEKAKDRRVQHG